MKKLTAKFLILFLFSFALLSNASFATAANTASVTLSSSCTSCEVGDQMSVSVSATVASSPIGGIEINLNYDQTKLSFQSVSYFSGQSDFADGLAESVNESAGVIHIERGKQGGLYAGTGQIFDATFLVTAAGNAAFSASPIDAAGPEGRVALTSNSLSLSLAAPSPSSSSNSTPPSTGQSSSNQTQTSGNKNTGTKRVTDNFSKSEVSFDKETATADGNDKICGSVLVKNNGKIISSEKPTVTTEGGVDLSEVTQSNDAWSFCFTSTAVGEKRITVAVKGTLIKDQNVEFVALFAKQSDLGTKTFVSRMVLDILSVKGQAVIAKKKDLFNKKEITDIDFLAIAGSAPANSKLSVTIHSNEEIKKEVVADASGKWRIELDNPLSVGNHEVKAAVIDNYGTESDSRTIAVFEVVKSYNLIILLSVISFVVLVVGYLLIVNRRRKNPEMVTGENIETPNPPINPQITGTTVPTLPENAPVKIDQTLQS